MRILGTIATLGLLFTSLEARGQESDPPEEEEEILGAAAAFSLVEEERERVWVAGGTPIFDEPSEGASRLEIVMALSEIDVLERSGDWCRVQYGGRSGWVNPELELHLQGIRVVEMPSTLPVETPTLESHDPERRRELALAALGLEGPNGSLGPWALMTDVVDSRLIGYLDAIAGGLTTSYASRFGLEPAPPSTQSVAVFSTEEGYRPFESEATHLAGFGARGHAGGKLAALFIEDHRMEDAASLLIHELTHLMNRTALGPSPPPWIEEGLANDLAYSRIGRAGDLRLGTVNGERVAIGTRRSGMTIQYSGGVAALAELVRTRARRRGTKLSELVQLDQASFLDDPRRSQHYIEAAFLVRFLLEADKGRHAESFRSYLRLLADPDQKLPADLASFLGTEWPRLERDFDGWLRIEAVALTR